MFNTGYSIKKPINKTIGSIFQKEHIKIYVFEKHKLCLIFTRLFDIKFCKFNQNLEKYVSVN